jgi:L-idonate 5-dehydrogenase
VKTVTIHAAGDLRIDDYREEEPGEKQVEIAVAAGGICGSDLHYYRHGGFGVVRLREPMILGHEVSGVVQTVGSGVSAVHVGDLVAINPSRPCGDCDYCQRGLQNHCHNMLFYGSAMRFPHVQGAFRERLIVEERQCFALPAGTSIHEAAFAEPFAVALHAVSQAGPLIGRRVLVTGCGPIGALVIVAARFHGAVEIVATDVVDEALEKAISVGADRAINVARNLEAMAEYAAGKGTFDVMFEASGNEAALRSGLDALRPRGILVQLGLGGEVTVPQNLIVAKELNIRGSFRFHEEFALAAALIGQRRVDLRPLLTHTLPLGDAKQAFDLAGDRKRAMKVQLLFGGDREAISPRPDA